MHESERAAAEAALGTDESTDSFAMGEADDGGIAQLRAAGLIVQVVPEPAAEPAEEESSPIAGPFAFGVTRGGAGATAALDAAVLAEVDWYVVRLRGPLLEGQHARLTALGVDLARAQGTNAYEARLSSQRVAEVTALPFVDGVKWLSPAQSAPRVATQGATR